MRNICDHLSFIVSDKSKKGKYIYKDGLKYDCQIRITWNGFNEKINKIMDNDIKLHIIGGEYYIKNLIWIKKLQDIYLEMNEKCNNVIYINVVFVHDGQCECYLGTEKPKVLEICDYIICQNNTLMIKYFIPYNNLFQYMFLHGMCLYNENRCCEYFERQTDVQR